MVAVWVGSEYSTPGMSVIPVAGAVLSPNTDYQVVLVTTLNRAGKWTMPSFDVDYQVGGVEYVAHVFSGLQLCAPATDPCTPG